MKKYLLFLLTSLAFSNLNAQTLAKAQEYYKLGNYEKAKPVFYKYVKSRPTNGDLNLWYGVCCLNTNDAENAIKYLQTAVKRRTPSGQFYLGQAYAAIYEFEKSIEILEEYRAELEKRKRSTEEADELLEKVKSSFRMLKGVEQVCIIDSFVVDKDHFLETYRLSEESGHLYTHNEFFNSKDTEGTVFKNEIGNKLYYAEKDEKGQLNIFQKSKNLNEWSKGKKLPDNINASGNTNYPFVLSDGTTIYYASDGKESMGGYDIFVTRYNTYSDNYLNPENIGMPFNSPYNDYMYVIDEFNELGWFASDRYQPKDKVCIYVFLPNQAKHTYDYETMNRQQLIRLAQIRSIKESWTDPEKIANARARLTHVTNRKPEERKDYDFTYIIHDRCVYHYESDFKSEDARVLFLTLQQKKKDLTQLQEKLENLRNDYSRSDEKRKNSLSPAILDLEKRIKRLSEETHDMDITVRNTEILKIKNL